MIHWNAAGHRADGASLSRRVVSRGGPSPGYCGPSRPGRPARCRSVPGRRRPAALRGMAAMIRRSQLPEDDRPRPRVAFWGLESRRHPSPGRPSHCGPGQAKRSCPSRLARPGQAVTVTTRNCCIHVDRSLVGCVRVFYHLDWKQRRINHCLS
jgi:hypothetical protein